MSITSRTLDTPSTTLSILFLEIRRLIAEIVDYFDLVRTFYSLSWDSLAFPAWGIQASLASAPFYSLSWDSGVPSDETLKRLYKIAFYSLSWDSQDYLKNKLKLSKDEITFYSLSWDSGLHHGCLCTTILHYFLFSFLRFYREFGAFRRIEEPFYSLSWDSA